MQRNYATLSCQVVSREKQLKEAKEKLRTTVEVEVASTEVNVTEAKQEAHISSISYLNKFK